MQRITNCILVKDNRVLLLQKPRRGWWVAPGGKMESGEHIREAVVREFQEETAIEIKNPTLKGVFTFVIQENNQTVSEWMMFSFLAAEHIGNNNHICDEGTLEWHSTEAIASLPMAAGDRRIIDYVLHGNGILYGTFVYTPDFELISYRLDPS
ncbi:NUDIX hydrolase [Ectobacillus polymachus]|uniref:NUDIX hydrolase n=1 Tax=Ectobacillus polymachus TaxID=1508806 RepID=UPI003A88FD20